MAHNNTVLHQMLNFVDRHEFQCLENSQFRPKRKYRSLSRLGAVYSMLFAQITVRASLRDITDSLQTQDGRLSHFGMDCVKKSTLADANNNRTSDFFHALFEKSYKQCSSISPNKKEISFQDQTLLFRLFDNRPVPFCFFMG